MVAAAPRCSPQPQELPTFEGLAGRRLRRVRACGGPGDDDEQLPIRPRQARARRSMA